jgi:hypothetical protein
VSEVLAAVPRAGGQGTWTIVKADDGLIYCNCPAWRFQKDEPHMRKHCKHITEYLQTLARTPPAKDFDKELEEITRQLKEAI